MSLQVKGMQELIDYFERQARVKVSKDALKKAGDVVLKEEEKVAKDKHRKYWRPKGYQNIRKFPIRNYHGSAFIDIGLKVKKGSANDGEWDAIRGLYFNHYGFWHNKTGKYVAGSGWMDVAFDNSQKQALQILEEGMLKELDL